MPSIDRRTLLIGGGVGVGLVVAFALWPRGLDTELAAGTNEQAFGNYLKIARDGRVTVAVAQAETGQGIWTALPQIVADELGAAWENVGVEPAPLAGIFVNPLAAEQGWLEQFGTLRAHRLSRDGSMRITAGSTSIRAFEQPMREAAAVARAMLIGAAAERWDVDPEDCHASDGLVLNGTRSSGFGELAEEAARRTPPSLPAMRGGAARLAGQPLQRLDAPAKASGRLRFAGDVRLPDMLYASARVAPPGGRLAGFDRGAIHRMPGVRHIAVRDGWIAVAADTWWTAEQALKAANPRFAGEQSPASLRPIYEAALSSGDAATWFARGDWDSFTEGSRPLATTYFVAPSQHLGLEPLSATARVRGSAVEVWAATQAPGLARASAARAAGLSAGDVTLYPLPAGEPAGRALEADAIPLAVELARQLERPVQVTLSQGSSQNHDRMASGALARMSALPGQGGLTAALRMQVATGNGFASALARLAGTDRPNSLGSAALSGLIPVYAIPNMRIETAPLQLPFVSGYMRGSPEREFCFFIESFIDELARAAGMEPLAFRMTLLGGNPRLARCLQTAAQLAGWDGGARGSTMGIAGFSAYGSHIGLVANASVEAGQSIRVHSLAAAVDCGRVINPGIVRQQIEGGLLWALTQATMPPAELVAGMPRARAMGPLLPRIGDTPEIRVHVLPSNADPGGVSGLGTVALAPALANAIHSATGKRLRELPFDPTAPV